MGCQAPNEIQTAILLLELHDSDTNQAQQSRVEADSCIEVVLHKGFALDRERQTVDLERRITDLERRTKQLELLYAKVQQAAQELKTAAVGHDLATWGFKSEQRRYQTDFPAMDAHWGYRPFPSRIQHEEAGLGERGPRIKTEKALFHKKDVHTSRQRKALSHWSMSLTTLNGEMISMSIEYEVLLGFLP